MAIDENPGDDLCEVCSSVCRILAARALLISEVLAALKVCIPVYVTNGFEKFRGLVWQQKGNIT